MENVSVPPPQRRKFLYGLLAALGAALTALAGWPVLRFLSPGGGGDAAATVTIPREKVADAPHFFEFHGRPAVALQVSPGSYVALSAVCTHLGCIVKWQQEKQQFLCPCHGGLFSADGAVLGGPPPAALETYPLTVQGDALVVG